MKGVSLSPEEHAALKEACENEGTGDLARRLDVEPATIFRIRSTGRTSRPTRRRLRSVLLKLRNVRDDANEEKRDRARDVRAPQSLMGWTTQGALVLRVFFRDEKTLQVLLNPVPGTLEWVVLSVEARMPEEGDSPGIGAAVNRTLEHHAHANVGTFRGVHEAMAAAEKFADAWKRRQRKGRSSPECPCPPIEGARE